MNGIRALYSVAQFVPDFVRAEAANVGVVLFCAEPRFLEARMSESLKRVRRVFAPGRQELRRLEAEVSSLAARLERLRDEVRTEEEFAQFISARADRVRLTPARLLKVDEPWAALERLYSEVVGDPAHILTAGMETAPLPARVAEAFGRLEAAGKAWRPHRITVPVAEKSLDVAVAFQNGRVNYVRPEALSGRAHLDDRMARLGFHGQLIYRHPVDGRSGQLVILSTDPEADTATEERFRQTLGEFDVRFVPHDEADAFAEEVEQTAH